MSGIEVEIGIGRKLVLRTFMVVSLIVVLAAISTRASPQTIVSVAPSEMTVTVGQTFSVNIEISDVIDLYGWEFKLKWNSTFLNVLNITEGDFFKSGGDTFFWPIWNNTAGCVLADCTLIGNIPGVNGSGTLAIVEFKVESAGESILDLYDSTLVSSLEQPIIHETTDGYGNFTTALIGDINGDGIVDIYDVVLAALAFDSRPGDPNWNQAADLNNDDVVDIFDIVLLANNFGKTA